MKTFLDVVNSANDADILKSYRINGMPVQFTAAQFKHVIKDIPIQLLSINPSDSYLFQLRLPTIVGSLQKINSNTLSITFKYSCDDCEGTGEIDCPTCNGTGECDCNECGATHDCGNCEGQAVYECERCANNTHEEDDIFYTEINLNLNQGELF